MLKRTNIWLTESQHKAIAKLAKKDGIKAAEVTRRLIDEALVSREQK